MPHIAFRMMTFMMRVHDIFKNPDEILENFGIQSGFVVVDYGCGPARYIKKASSLAGSNGLVYAADIHELAIQKAEECMAKHRLHNVTPVTINGYSCDIPREAADVVYALDMFHMVKNPTKLLRELNRIAKKSGELYIDDGHQPRRITLKKIRSSGAWKIVEENKRYLLCKPRK